MNDSHVNLLNMGGVEFYSANINSIESTISEHEIVLSCLKHVVSLKRSRCHLNSYFDRAYVFKAEGSNWATPEE
jgi:hypothetical protein